MNSKQPENSEKVSVTNFSEIMAAYDVFILDIWGVIHDGFKPYPGAVACVNRLLEMKKKIIFLSNAPRPGSLLMKKLIDFGIASGASIISSGDVVRTQLQTFSDPNFSKFDKQSTRCYHLGAARNQDILAELSLEQTDDLEKAGFILMTVYADEGEDLNQYNEILERALKYHIPVICANPDTEIMNGEKLRYCAGVFAEKYERMGGKVHYYGKPHPAVYETIFEKLQNNQQNLNSNFNHANFDKSPNFDKSRILMVGDTLETDILGAKRAGIHSALTLTGNMARYLAKNSSRGLSEADLLHELFIAEKITPNWVIPGLYL